MGAHQSSILNENGELHNVEAVEVISEAVLTAMKRVSIKNL